MFLFFVVSLVVLTSVNRTTNAADCPAGKYGANCLLACGKNCNNCDKVKGCTACVPGKTGLPICDQNCTAGTFGLGCSGRCSSRCAKCDIVFGCTSCEAGKTGLPLCDIECIIPFYGRDCAQECTYNCSHCDPVKGCTSCIPGMTGVPLCNQVCRPGTYGMGCLKCGNCYKTAVCNVVDGKCASGCQAGYQGNLCLTSCNSGQFGRDCKYKCKACRPGDVCDPVSGVCPYGCAAGFIGATCSAVDTSVLKVFCEANGTGTARVACDNKEQSLSIIHANYGRKAVKHCPMLPGYRGKFCNKFEPYYTAKMRALCNGRSSCEYDFPDNSTGDSCVGYTKYFDVKYICLRCSTTTWGRQCDHPCHCRNGKCDPDTGVCPPGGCLIGWRRNFCDLPCSNMTHGEECEEKCNHKVCHTCDPVKGCTVCIAGRAGPPSCNRECSPGTYGVGCINCGNCAEDKPCQVIHGQCPHHCQTGYHGIRCDLKCDKQHFGVDCKFPCGKCREGGACDSKTGACPLGCAAGYTGRSCSQALWIAIMCVFAPFYCVIACGILGTGITVFRESAIRRSHYKLHTSVNEGTEAELTELDHKSNKYRSPREYN